MVQGLWARQSYERVNKQKYSNQEEQTSMPGYIGEKQLFVLCSETSQGFPSGAAVKNPPANAGEPWYRKIPHAAEQLSPCATTTEPAL